MIHQEIGGATSISDGIICLVTDQVLLHTAHDGLSVALQLLIFIVRWHIEQWLLNLYLPKRSQKLGSVGLPRPNPSQAKAGGV